MIINIFPPDGQKCQLRETASIFLNRVFRILPGTDFSMSSAHLRKNISRRTPNNNKTHKSNTYEVQYTIARRLHLKRWPLHALAQRLLLAPLHSKATTCSATKWLPKLNPENLEGRSAAEPGSGGRCPQTKANCQEKGCQSRIVVIPKDFGLR